MLRYPAVIKHVKEDDAWYVNFPDLKGCFTDGNTIEEAKANAQDVLNGYLEVAYSRNIKVNSPSNKKGKNVFYFEPEHHIAFAIRLRLNREKLGLSQTDVARKIGVSYQAYQKFETPTKSNPTLKTISKIENVLGTNLIQI
jgi:antitoxin HicB